MRTTDFAAVGFIDTVLAPDFELIDGRERETVSFDLITEDNLRFECQTDDRQIAFRKLQGIDCSRLYRCKGYFQRIDGHQVFIVSDLNLSTSVPSRTGPRLSALRVSSVYVAKVSDADTDCGELGAVSFRSHLLGRDPGHALSQQENLLPRLRA